MTLWTLLLVHLAALAVPGLDFFVVTQTAIRQGVAAGIRVAAGVATAILIWAALAVTGLAFLVSIVWVKTLLTLLGAGYLAWLGLQLLVSARRGPSDAPDAQASRAATTVGGSFVKGLVTNLSNPKAVIYFGSIFTAFLLPDAGIGHKLLLLALVTIESLLWFLLIAKLFSQPPMRRAYARRQRLIESLSAGLFLLFAVYMLVVHIPA